MRMITKAMIAVGFVGVMAGSASVPAGAQQIYFSGPGVGVEVTTRPYYRYRGYDAYGYSGYERRSYYGRRHYSTWNGCPPNYTIQDGRCKPYRGY